MGFPRLLGELSNRAKSGVKQARRRGQRGGLPLSVAELMTHDVRSCRSDDALTRPATIMWERDCGIVPVLDAADRVVGVVTDRDVAMAALTQGQPLEGVQVATAMSKGVWAVRPQDSLDVAQRIMGDQQVRRLPVIDDAGELVGVLSVGDVLRRAGGRAEGPGGTAVRERLLETLTAIARPRPS